MNGYDSLTFDKCKGFYVEFDEDTNYYGVFGLETGFMYLMFETKEQANEKANELNKSYNLEVLILSQQNKGGNNAIVF